MAHDHTLAIAPRTLLFVFAGVVFLGWASSIATFVSLMVLSLILAASLVPGVRFFRKRFGLKHEIAVMAVFGVLLVGIGLTALLIVPTVLEQARTLAAELPRYVAKAQETFAWLQHLRVRFPLLPDLQAISATAAASASAWVGSSLGLAGKLMGWLVMAFIVLTVAFFLLLEGPTLRVATLALVPPPHRPLIAAQIEPITLKLGGYVQGMAISIAVLTVYLAIILSLLGLPLALVLALLGGLLAIIPMVGGILGVIPPALVGLSISWQTAVWALVWGYLGNFVVANFMMPIVFARSVKLSPLMITLALLVGGEALGIFGALVAVPVAAAIQVLVQNLYIEAMERRYATSERSQLRFGEATLAHLHTPANELD